MVSVHSAVSQDSVCSGSVEARQLMGFVYCKLFRLSKLKSVSGAGRSCLSVCGQIRAFKNGSCSSDWLKGKSAIEEPQGFAGQ
jgi:hypothetical protein